MATHSSTLAWKIPRTEETCRLHPWGRKELDTAERLHFTTDTLKHPLIRIHRFLSQMYGNLCFLFLFLQATAYLFFLHALFLNTFFTGL